MGRKKKGDEVSGWVCFDKPHGLGSTQAVSFIKRLYNAQKAGHAGTLDPLASGILPIALGEATKTVPYLMEADKVYRFTVRWGLRTASYDLEGEVLEQNDLRPTEAEIRDILPIFIGEIEQAPPAFSAIKVDGKRAYDLAREGVEFELETRPVTVHDLTLERMVSDNEAEFLLHCGKGTYVRSIARDMALELGVLGVVSVLRRERVGGFNLNLSAGVEKLEDLRHRDAAFEALLAVETALDDIPALPVTEDEAAKLKQGRDIALSFSRTETAEAALKIRGQSGKSEHGRTLWAHKDGQIVALGELRLGVFYPTRILNLNS
ncbi:tRNA pseudouridine(55) synthase TruB [Asticcacaulis sp. YBE204]|uniref:tRNA pseudouridine(55) synthase TruB n=1 Tax=Asticcacaulis sp. YBE204 TaxID=1282363 RepID=UPI0003C3BC18|nr:tRNA pseudouridine(55) synthase TruB [Asticcacaulis sp. YBE204]ESQ80955.1 tRNA pseudouridine synthase B [Asticcacaulis sp. YBE204]